MNPAAPLDIPESDQILWNRVRQGSEAGFTTLFDRYHATLYNYGCKLSVNTSLVEDAVQDVFIDVWRLRKTLTSEVTSVKFYLFRALRRRIHRAQLSVPASQEISETREQEPLLITQSSETHFIADESHQRLTGWLRSSVARLPSRQAEVITLRYFEEFTIPEIARIMGVSEKSVRNFIYKALCTLRETRPALLSQQV